MASGAHTQEELAAVAAAAAPPSCSGDRRTNTFAKLMGHYKKHRREVSGVVWKIPRLGTIDRQVPTPTSNSPRDRLIADICSRHPSAIRGAAVRAFSRCVMRKTYSLKIYALALDTNEM